jgi:hypothetical protein
MKKQYLGQEAKRAGVPLGNMVLEELSEEIIFAQSPEYKDKTIMNYNGASEKALGQE